MARSFTGALASASLTCNGARASARSKPGRSDASANCDPVPLCSLLRAKARAPQNSAIEFHAIGEYLSRMCRLILLLALCSCTGWSVSAQTASGRVIKVLPHFLDLNGRHSISPSLFDRDAYQAYLRVHPEMRSGVRFDIQWKSSRPIPAGLKFRLELVGSARGGLISRLTVEQLARPDGTWLGPWSSIIIGSDEYRDLGEITAWRLSLWDGAQLLSEQKSYLW